MTDDSRPTPETASTPEELKDDELGTISGGLMRSDPLMVDDGGTSGATTSTAGTIGAKVGSSLDAAGASIESALSDFGAKIGSVFS
jgi:hypothetical protein